MKQTKRHHGEFGGAGFSETWSGFCQAVQRFFPNQASENDQRGQLSTEQVLRMLKNKPHLIPQVRQMIQALPDTSRYTLIKKIWHALLFENEPLSILARKYGIDAATLDSLRADLAQKVQPLLG